MEIVPATPRDAEGIAGVHVNAWQTSYRGIVSDAFLDAMNVEDRTKRWLALLADPNCEILVAKGQERVLGFVSFGRHRERQSSPEQGEIWTIYVHPQAWRSGVGRSLMTEALSTLGRSGYGSTWVWVLAANSQAIAFYSSCAFKPQPQSLRRFQLGEQYLEEVALVHNAA
ncbi:MAG: GNAT family N-acetyltransferase [Ideonella sp.]|nr:GNAT family N-acetyltransferase [Ideonella sp.]